MNPASALRVVLSLAAVLAVGPRRVRANPCKPDGEACRTNQSCCGGVCVNSAPPGRRPKGTCCTPTTCTALGADCGLVADGTCPDTLFCGDCPAGEVCGAVEPNVCGSTTTSSTTTSTITSTTSTTTPCTPGAPGCGWSTGDLTTYDQLGWDQTPGSTVLTNNFSKVYGGGSVIIGGPTYFLGFSDAAAVLA